MNALRTLALVPALVLALAAAACAGFDGSDAVGPSRITGRLIADRIPPDARIEVYRADGEGPAAPVVGVTARPDDTGRFTTAPVRPGRYVLVLRTKEAPPSMATATVPEHPDAELRLASPSVGTTVVLASPAAAPGARTVRLTPDAFRGDVADRREVVLLPGQEVRVAGLEAGLWHFDVLPDGATADFVVASGDEVPRFVIDPPASPGTGGVVEGVVLLRTSEPVRGMAVTARSATDDGFTIQPWGRFATVERNGSFRLDRLPEGTAFVRVERRGGDYAGLPIPELIRISPSETVERGYRVER